MTTPEVDDWDSSFDGVNWDNEPTTVGVTHHLGSGCMSITINKEVCYLGPDEWLRLVNFLLTNQNLRDWIDRRNENEVSKEIMCRLETFKQMGFKGRELLQAATLPPGDEERLSD